MSDLQEELIDAPGSATRVLTDARRIAVLGIKPESHGGQPAHYVPRYLHDAGYEIIPVPVYYPEVREILGKPVYRKLTEIPEPVDLVVMFRRSRDVPGHLEEMLEAAPKAVWMQSGIRHDATARALAEAGIRVVQNRCAMIEHRHVGR